MNTKQLLLKRKTVVGILALTLFTTHCNDLLQSTADSSSHNAGKNCLSCHDSGDKLLTIGGTVYTAIDSTTDAGGQGLKVRIKKNDKVLFTLPVDKSGNFYTDRDVNFPIKTTLTNGNAMVDSVNKGGCNKSGCHDSGNRIY